MMEKLIEIALGDLFPPFPRKALWKLLHLAIAALP